MANGKPITLLDAVTADEVGAWQSNGGGIHVIEVEGDFGSGTVTLQEYFKDSTYAKDICDEDGTVLEITSTSNYASRIYLTAGMQIRATLSGATDPDLSAYLV